MKKQIIVFTLCMITSSTYAEKEKKIKLKSDIIELLDGRSVGITGNTIGLMLQVRKEIKEMLYGKQDGDRFIGGYEFRGNKECVMSLTHLEAEETAAYYAIMNNTQEHSAQELADAKKRYEMVKEELAILLNEIKDDFKRITKSYVEGARGFKTQMLILIKESCELRDKNECFLLKWSEAEEGRETEALDKEVHSFEALTAFFTDLMHFLEDLVNSCDKAREQFMSKVRAHKSQNR